MGFLQRFLPPDDRYAALMLYGMVFATCFNGYDAGIMSVILADKQFQQYYSVDSNRSGIIATIPWATTGKLDAFNCLRHLGFLIQMLLRFCSAVRCWYSCECCWATLGLEGFYCSHDYWSVCLYIIPLRGV